MRAARLHEYKTDLRIDEVPTPEPGPGEVLVRIGGAGVCHSDLHLTTGELPMLPEMPWTLGHENAGFVEALGSGAGGIEVGTPVAVFGGWGCGRCRFCLGGEEQICDVMRWGGIGGGPGGWAEYMVVPAVRHLLPLGDLDPADAAPLTDAGLTPYRAVMKARARLRPGTTAVSIGVGGLGQFGLQYLRELTPARIVALDIDAGKRRQATDLGADLVLDPLHDDVVEEIRKFTAGDGAAAVIDYVGSDSTLAIAGATTGRQGLVAIVGLAGGALAYSFLGVASETEVVSSSWGNRNELAEVLALAASGRVHIDVERHPLEDVNAVLERLGRGEIAGRAVLTP